MAPLFSKADLNKLCNDVQNKVTFLPNLVKVYLIFLKLYAVKQSGPVFLAYPISSDMLLTSSDLLYL